MGAVATAFIHFGQVATLVAATDGWRKLARSAMSFLLRDGWIEILERLTSAVHDRRLPYVVAELVKPKL